MTSAFDRLVAYDPECDDLVALAASAKAEGASWSTPEELQQGFTCFFARNVISEPQGMLALREALDFMATHGATPFAVFPDGSSLYHSLVMSDPEEEILEWCRSLPCAPQSTEVDPARRLRSDILDEILCENPQPASMGQIAALDVFGFKLLETWADGRTTLDRILYRYFQWNQIEGRGPRKDFEWVEVQRGFTRLTKKLLHEDVHSTHVHAIRWHALHHASSCQHKMQSSWGHRDWGKQDWQASLRNLDQLICLGQGKSVGKTREMRLLALREEGVEYAAARNLPHYWASILASAASYDFLDNENQRKPKSIINALRHPEPYHDVDVDIQWSLQVATVVEGVLTGCAIDEADMLFDSSPGWKLFSRDLISKSPFWPIIQEHQALVSTGLPLLARNGLWGGEEKAMEAAIFANALLPNASPFSEWIHRAAERSDKVRMSLDAQTLADATSSASHARHARRF